MDILYVPIFNDGKPFKTTQVNRNKGPSNYILKHLWVFVAFQFLLRCSSQHPSPLAVQHLEEHHCPPLLSCVNIYSVLTPTIT